MPGTREYPVSVAAMPSLPGVRTDSFLSRTLSRAILSILPLGTPQNCLLYLPIAAALVVSEPIPSF